MSRKIWFIGLLVTIVLISGCNSPKTVNEKILTGEDKVSVDIKNFAFDPARITISKGSTVTWTNKDDVSHTVSGDNNFDSDQLSQNMTFSWTFEEIGTFAYHCKTHAIMKGKVTVI